MFQQLKNILGIKPGADLGELIRNGAQVIDVRSPEEYASGHIKGSLNIPLPDLPRQLRRISKIKPAIVCCASGMRSSSAKDILRSHGYSEVHNGGGWMSLQRKIK